MKNGELVSHYLFTLSGIHVKLVPRLTLLAQISGYVPVHWKVTSHTNHSVEVRPFVWTGSQIGIYLGELSTIQVPVFDPCEVCVVRSAPTLLFLCVYLLVLVTLVALFSVHVE